MNIKKKLVMLCAHEPNLDPRVKWEYTTASQHFDVTVIGMMDPRTPEVESRPMDSVYIKRVNYLDTNFAKFMREILNSLKRISPILYILFVLFTISTIYLLPVFLLYFLISSTRKIYQKGLMNSFRESKIMRKMEYNLPVKYFKILNAIFFNPIAFLLKILEKSFFWKKFDKLLFNVKSINYFYNSADDLKWLIKYIIRVNSALSEELKNNKNVFQVVHCNDLDSLIAGIVYKSKTGAKLIYDSHEFWPSAQTGAPKFHVLFFASLEFILVRIPDHIFTVNSLLANEMKKIYRLNIKSIINAEPWVENRIPLNNTLISNLSKGKIKYLYMGNFALQRGLEELLLAWDSLDSDNSILFLQGPQNNYKDDLYIFCNKLKTFNHSIFFIDPVSEDNLVSSAMQFDVGIIPYKPINIGYKFCCPNKLSQYLQAGLAIMANNLEFVKNVVQSNTVGVTYNDKDIDSIKNALNTFNINRNNLDNFKKNSKKLARTSFNWQSQEKVLLEAYC